MAKRDKIKNDSKMRADNWRLYKYEKDRERSNKKKKKFSLAGMIQVVLCAKGNHVWPEVTRGITAAGSGSAAHIKRCHDAD